MTDIIIIGAGVCGCAIARELSRKNASIVVVERAEDVCCGTSKANSAIVHAGYDAKHGTLMAKLTILIACGTVSTTSLEKLQQENDLPIVGVVEPTCRRALLVTKNKKVMVFDLLRILF